MLKLATLYVHAYLEEADGSRPIDVERGRRIDADDPGNPFARAWLLMQLIGEVNTEVARRAREHYLAHEPRRSER